MVQRLQVPGRRQRRALQYAWAELPRYAPDADGGDVSRRSEVRGGRRPANVRGTRGDELAGS
eukprot:3258771-Pyramimonas_sp.AAC.1